MDKPKKYPDFSNKKSVNTTFEVGDIISDDNLLWFYDALDQLSETVYQSKNHPQNNVREVTQKFRIKITKV